MTPAAVRPAAEPEDRAGGGPREPVFLGAFHDLERVVATHLFVICTNNSGSTFLQRALATSRRTWSLPWEGRMAVGYVGPRPANDPGLVGGSRILAARKRWLDILEDPAGYDWPRTRKAWYFQAHARDPAASVFVGKSTRSLLTVDALARHFRNARFLFMVRNPYAVCEGICRTLRRDRARGRLRAPREAALEGVRLEILAARHVAACLEHQRRNVEAFGERGRLFTYEAMCAEPERTARTIRELVPALDDLNLRQRLKVHAYHEMLTDMNARQIARLTPGQIAAFNRVFRRRRAVLDHFGYEVMDRLP